jgi:hypothetical protein
MMKDEVSAESFFMYYEKPGAFMKLFVLVFLALSAICFAQKKKIPSIISTGAIPKPPIEKPKKRLPQTPKSVEEKLKDYFYGREIVPSIIVNNTERDQTEIHLENNKIEWIRVDKEIKIKINDDIFSLKDKKTINSLRLSPLEQDDDYESVDFANNWEQIKFYKFGDRELIGISIGNEPCTGIGCSVSFQLIYDLKTKSKTFFGTYRIEREVNIYDFKNDGTIDYLGKTYVGESDGIAKEIGNVYKLYSIDEKGIFHLQLNSKQKPYFIKRTFEAESYREIDKKFESNWIEEIN